MSDHESGDEKPSHVDGGALDNVPPPALRQGGNTGVKGVLADYEEAKQKMYMLQQLENEQAWARVNASVSVAAPLSEQEKLGKVFQEEKDEENEDDDDDEFLAKYRLAKLEELKQQQQKQQQSSSLALGLFGSVLALDADQFVSCLDEDEHSRPSQWTLVHVWDPRVHECHALHRALEDCSRRVRHTRLVRVAREEVCPEVPTEVLPLVLAFEGGQQKHTWARIHDLVKPMSGHAMLAWMLQQKTLSTKSEEERQTLQDMVDEHKEKHHMQLNQQVQMIDPKLIHALTQWFK